MVGHVAYYDRGWGGEECTRFWLGNLREGTTWKTQV